MLKYVAIGAVFCGLIVLASDAQAGRRGCCCGYSGGTVVAPAPVPPPPAPPTAAAPDSTRTFSYEPAMYQPTYGAYGSWVSGRAYESAINKSLGRGFSASRN
ncbi:MAG TPA: hypothetical protein VFV87_00520 [Pirellulaceae bacterium]|nr:hypothetical protein [Pirellulaceae bacterium]